MIAEGVDKGPFWVVGFFAELYIDVGESGWSFDVALGSDGSFVKVAGY